MIYRQSSGTDPGSVAIGEMRLKKGAQPEALAEKPGGWKEQRRGKGCP